MKKMITGAMMLMAGAFFLLPAQQADAHRGGKHWKKKGKRGKRGCGKMLMRAKSWKLKKAGLNDAQITKLKSLRTNFKKTKIPLKAKIKLLRVDLKDLFDNATIDQGKVLALVGQMNTLKGQMKLLKVKTKLQIRALLTLEQRKKLRKMCRRKMRRHRRYGMRGFRKFGRHHKHGRHGRWNKRNKFNKGPSSKSAL